MHTLIYHNTVIREIVYLVYLFYACFLTFDIGMVSSTIGFCQKYNLVKSTTYKWHRCFSVVLYVVLACRHEDQITSLPFQAVQKKCLNTIYKEQVLII